METKTTELSLGQRLAADTPPFFKKVDLLGLALIAVAGGLKDVPSVPLWVIALVAGIGGAFTLLSRFAVQDTAVLANQNATVADYTEVLADLPNQFNQLHGAVTGIAETVKSIQAAPIPIKEGWPTTTVKEAPASIQQAVATQDQVGLGLASPQLTTQAPQL